MKKVYGSDGSAEQNAKLEANWKNGWRPDADKYAAELDNLNINLSGVLVDYNGAQVPVYRGGNTFDVKPDDIRINKENNKVKTTHGLSLDIDPNANAVVSNGGAYKIESLPEGLKIIHRGKRLEHYEIVPAYEMSLDEFRSLLNQIKTSKYE